MAKKQSTDAVEGAEEDLTPYPTQAQNDAAKLGGRVPASDEATAEPSDADSKAKADAEAKGRQVGSAAGTNLGYQTR